MTEPRSPKQLILIVDADAAATAPLTSVLQDHHLESRVLKESRAALEQALAERPLLILSEVAQEGIDGIALFQQVRAHPVLKEMPFVFTTRQLELEERLKLLTLEIDDLIAKPYYPEEVVARVESILRESAVLTAGEAASLQGFTGSLEEMTLIDLIQTLELGKKSATLHLVQEPEEGYVFVDQGVVIDAVLGEHPPEEALLKMMIWLQGYFELTMQPVQREPRITRSNRDLLQAGAQRLQEYKARAAQLPGMDSYVARAAEVIQPELSEAEARVWALLERPQPLRLLVASAPADELRTIEVIQGLLEDKRITVAPGTASDADLLARDISLKLAAAQQGNTESSSRIAAFFTRNGSQKKNLI
ncbi:MAG TPA: DUF4388 domain-containing protein [bacterium]|nr:DUF4388 domain-containing protein [bacterium]HPR86544.1 DUF4388 domain-containing protein [bacterium]